MPGKGTTGSKDADYQAAIKRFTRSAEHDRQDRDSALDDIRFLGGQQWAAEEVVERRESSSQTINLLPKFVRQVTGEARLNEVRINVLPEDGEANIATAKVLKGMVRGIEDESEAESIYDECLDNAASCGRGAMRLFTEYANEMDFNQCIKIDSIEDPMAVYWDRNAKRYDKADAEYVFVVEWISKEEYKEKYPDRDPSSFNLGAVKVSGWKREGEVRIAEYYYKNYDDTKELWLLEDGTVIDKEMDPRTKDTFKLAGFPVIATRIVKKAKVFRRVMDGAGWCSEEEEIASQYLPIIPVMGPKLKVDGKIQYHSVIRWSKAPQQNYNLWTSNISEKAALAPRAPWIGTPTMFKGRENQWRDANKKNFAYLVYNPDPKVHPRARPERNDASPVQQSEIGLLLQAENDLKGTSGFYNASLSDQGPERAGVAIQKRQSSAEVASVGWIDNLHKSIRQLGRVMLDMIPKVYDTERIVRLVNDEDATEWVKLNQQTQILEEGKNVVKNNVTVGKYGVKVDTGPSYKTQREESASALTAIMGAVPQYASALVGPAVRNMDFKDAQKVSRRLDIMTGWRQPTEEDEMPSQQSDPRAEAEAAKAQADLEGKHLVNAQRRYDLAGDLQNREAMAKTMEIMQNMLSRPGGVPSSPGGGGQGGSPY